MSPPSRRRISNITRLLPKKQLRSLSPPSVQGAKFTPPRAWDSLPPGVGYQGWDDGKEKRNVRKFGRNRHQAQERENFAIAFRLPSQGSPVISSGLVTDEELVAAQEYDPIMSVDSIESDEDHADNNDHFTTEFHDPVSDESNLTTAVYEDQISHQSHSTNESSACACNNSDDMRLIRLELRCLRESQDVCHSALTETAQHTLRLAEVLGARVDSMQSSSIARPSEKLFWMLVDGMAALLLFVISIIAKPWTWARSSYAAEKVRRRKSWRLSVAEFEDPFLGDAAKRLSFSARGFDND